MHILEIPSFFPPLGGQFCLDQAKALSLRGHEVRILACVQLGMKVNGSFYYKAPMCRWWETMEGIEVYRTFMHGLPRIVRYNRWHWQQIVLSMYHDYVKRYGKPDLLHAHCCSYAGVVARTISRREGIPYFITEHLPSMILEADFGKGWTKHQKVRDIMKQTYQDANGVVAVSQELIDDIAQYFGKDYNYKEISNTIDTDFYSYKEREKREGRALRVCCLAIAEIERKGYDVLAQAWHDMGEMELHIAGRDTDGDAMQQLFEGKKNVTLYGHKDKEGVRELLWHCDVLVLPSRSEAQPLVLLEAMSTGMPVISTEVMPQSERIDGACKVIASGDALALHEALLGAHDMMPSRKYSEAVQAIASPAVVAEALEEFFNANK